MAPRPASARKSLRTEPIGNDLQLLPVRRTADDDGDPALHTNERPVYLTLSSATLIALPLATDRHDFTAIGLLGDVRR